MSNLITKPNNAHVIYTKRDRLTPEEREAMNQFFTNPLTQKNMSIWDKSELAEVPDDNSNSMFLNKALGDGDSITVKFVDVLKQMQREETPDMYKSTDGHEFNFYFEDSEGKERKMTQKNTKGLFYRAMREAKVEPGEMITIARKGLRLETEYTITRVTAEGAAPVETKDEIPF